MKRTPSAFSAKKLWLAGLLVAAVVGGIFANPAYQWARTTFAAFMQPSEEQIVAMLERMAKDLNSKTPKNVNEDAQLIRVVPGPGRRMEYVYRLVGPKALAKDAFTKERLDHFKAVQGGHVTAGACAIEQMRRDYFANGVTVVYAYAGKNADTLAKFEVRAADCGMGS